jgi:hypothetical protein
MLPRFQARFDLAFPTLGAHQRSAAPSCVREISGRTLAIDLGRRKVQAVGWQIYKWPVFAGSRCSLGCVLFPVGR